MCKNYSGYERTSTWNGEAKGNRSLQVCYIFHYQSATVVLWGRIWYYAQQRLQPLNELHPFMGINVKSVIKSVGLEQQTQLPCRGTSSKHNWQN